ncbi:MAG: RDD family protein [Oscillospiraceae bacterium]|nr:RDD family protein [Oscillospiraceae bacterium]
MNEQTDQQSGGTVPPEQNRSSGSGYGQTPPKNNSYGSGYGQAPPENRAYGYGSGQAAAGNTPPYQGPPSADPVLVMGYPGGERRYVRLASRGRRIGAAIIDRILAGIPVTIISVILLFRLLVPLLSYSSSFSPYNYQNQAADPSAYSLTSQAAAAGAGAAAQPASSYDPYEYDFDDLYPDTDDGSDNLYAYLGSDVFVILLKYIFQITLWSWGICLIFYVLIPLFTGGRTLGKLMLNLRPVKARGQLLTHGGILGRQLLMLILAAFVDLISLLTILFTAKYQALHDFICDTVVIDERPF